MLHRADCAKRHYLTSIALCTIRVGYYWKHEVEINCFDIIYHYHIKNSLTYITNNSPCHTFWEEFSTIWLYLGKLGTRLYVGIVWNMWMLYMGRVLNYSSSMHYVFGQWMLIIKCSIFYGCCLALHSIHDQSQWKLSNASFISKKHGYKLNTDTQHGKCSYRATVAVIVKRSFVSWKCKCFYAFSYICPRTQAYVS